MMLGNDNAQMVYKSAKFCHASLSDNKALLLLCEVVAKPFFEQIYENSNADTECRAMKALCVCFCLVRSYLA